MSGPYAMEEQDETLGSALIRMRSSLGFSREDIAHEIKAPVSYIASFENQEYAKLPARIYAEGFLKKYTARIAPALQDEIMRRFRVEWEVQSRMNAHSAEPVRSQSSFAGRPIWISKVFIGGVIALFVAFIAFRLFDFLGKPALTITEPVLNTVSHEPRARLKGIVARESRLTVNGREITIDEYGNFDEMVELGSGLTALEFLVRDKFGKENKEVRHILVQ